MQSELYVTIESGGSIGEVSNRGYYRVSGKPMEKEEAIKHTRSMSKMFGGGYYGYKYMTKPLSWALKNTDYKEDKDGA